MAEIKLDPSGVMYINFDKGEVDDGLVDKYRVFRIPGHLARLPNTLNVAPIIEFDDDGDVAELEEVDAFVFVLKPNHDHHARVALSAYAASCAIEKPQLSKDLYDLLSQDEWGSD